MIDLPRRHRESHFRKQNGQRDFRGEHATRVVTAERDDDYLMLGVVLCFDVGRESLAARESRRSLGHRRTGRIKPRQRQNIQLAQQISYRPRSQLLLQLIVRNLSCVTRAVLQTVWPVIESRAVATISERS